MEQAVSFELQYGMILLHVFITNLGLSRWSTYATEPTSLEPACLSCISV